jgi:hypothetical protein
MMKKIIAFLLLLTFFACANNDLPKGVLPEAKMREVMWDVMRADEWILYEANIDTTMNKHVRSHERYQQVLQLHHVSEEQFKKSFQYYQSNPTLLKPVLDSLQKRNTIPPTIPKVQ